MVVSDGLNLSVHTEQSMPGTVTRLRPIQPLRAYGTKAVCPAYPRSARTGTTRKVPSAMRRSPQSRTQRIVPDSGRSSSRQA